MPTDNFNRADGGLGSNWTTFGSWTGLQIASNQVVPTTASAENASYYNAWTPGSADQYAQVRVVAYGNGGPLVRVAPAGPDGYLAAGHQFSTKLYRVVAGGYTQIGSTGAGLQSLGGLGLILRIEANGTTIRLLYDGVEVISATDSAIQGAGVGGGLYDYHNATGTYDDWEADTLTPVVGPARIRIASPGWS